jgi:hypothetical protein
VTTPAVYAEGLRTLWFLASRGVAATWDGATVVLAPPEPVAEARALEAVLRPVDGRSYLQRARARHASFLREVNDAKPADATNRQWRDAIEGLESFLLSGWSDEALRLGWPRDELFKVPELWSQIDRCGCALLIAGREVIGITPGEIRIKTSSGGTLAFYRRPTVDYALVFRERLKRLGLDAGKEEVRLRAVEHAVNVCRANTGLDLESAKRMVSDAIKAAREQGAKSL